MPLYESLLATQPTTTIFQKLDGITGLMSGAQVCELINCHPKTLLKWTQENRIAAIRMGRHYRYDPVDVYDFLRKRRVKAK